MEIDAKSRTKRCCQKTTTCGRTHQREGAQINLYATCRRSFVNHDVNAVVLHRTIQIFLHYRRKSVNLIDEKHIIFLQRGENTRQIAWLVQHRTRSHLKTHAQLVGDDVAQRCLSQARRAMQQCMVKGFPTKTSSLHKHTQVLHHLCLSAEIVKPQRAQGIFEVLVLRVSLFSYVKIFCHLQIVHCNLSNYT